MVQIYVFFVSFIISKTPGLYYQISLNIDNGVYVHRGARLTSVSCH